MTKKQKTHIFSQSMVQIRGVEVQQLGCLTFSCVLSKSVTLNLGCRTFDFQSSLGCRTLSKKCHTKFRVSYFRFSKQFGCRTLSKSVTLNLGCRTFDFQSSLGCRTSSCVQVVALRWLIHSCAVSRATAMAGWATGKILWRMLFFDHKISAPHLGSIGLVRQLAHSILWKKPAIVWTTIRATNERTERTAKCVS